MTVQKTLAIIKPDAVSLGETGAILQLAQKAGLQIQAMKQTRWSEKEVSLFYAEHVDAPYYEKLARFMSSGPVVLVVFSGENAISLWRSLMGATDPQKAEPQSIRARFGGKKMPANATHGSDSETSALRELGVCFSPDEIFDPVPWKAI